MRNGNWDIYGYDLNTQSELLIALGVGNQANPDIRNEFIVWQDDRNGDYDIFGLDLSTMLEFPIATGLGDQLNPSISGNTVVWEDGGNIYGAVVPEPCTLLLIGFGGLFLRKKILINNYSYVSQWL